MKVILDPKAGTCGGVRRAIYLAEKELADDQRKSLFVLGDIIHNEREVERLDNAGLKTLLREELEELIDRHKHPRDAKVLVRAHGEPPETYKKLEELGVEIIDGTCPVVTRSQDLAKQHEEEGWQVVIVGKHRHPEMIGIVGHTNHKAIIIQYDEDIQKLKPGIRTFVMAQTTINPDRFKEMTLKIRTHVGEIKVLDTLCRFVVKREKKLPEFALQADVILVVGGHKSSNTKMLLETCHKINPRSYQVVSPSEIIVEWFEDARTIGVTGSASTPLWLLNEFVETLNRWIRQGWPEREIITTASPDPSATHR